MGPLRILFVAPYPPGAIWSRSYHLLRRLLDHGHVVTLACPDDRGLAQGRLQELGDRGAHVVSARVSPAQRALNALGALLLRRPFVARSAWSPRLARRIANELRSHAYDVFHVEHLGAACYALGAAELLSRSATARVWDCGEGQSDSAARRRMHHYEGRMAQSFDRVLVLSHHDLHSLARAAGRIPRQTSAASLPVEGLGLLPNGVDCERFAFRDPTARSQVVIFSGSMENPANAAAARFLVDRVMPVVWHRRPDLPVVVVGPAPPRSVRAAAMAHPERVQAPGFVPDLAPYLAAAAVAVAPMPYPGGPRLKVLEALACGTPVVTDAGTSHAIGAMHEGELLVAGDPQEFAAAILRLLADHGLRQRLGRAGRRLVVERFSWARLAGELESHYDEAIAARRRRVGPTALARVS